MQSFSRALYRVLAEPRTELRTGLRAEPLVELYTGASVELYAELRWNSMRSLSRDLYGALRELWRDPLAELRAEPLAELRVEPLAELRTEPLTRF